MQNRVNIQMRTRPELIIVVPFFNKKRETKYLIKGYGWESADCVQDGVGMTINSELREIKAIATPRKAPKNPKGQGQARGRQGQAGVGRGRRESGFPFDFAQGTP